MKKIVFFPFIYSCIGLRHCTTFRFHLFNAMQWRCIGPHRGGRTVGAVGVPSQPNVFYIGVNNAACGRPLILAEHGNLFLTNSQRAALEILRYRLLTLMCCMPPAAKVCSAPTFLLAMAFINLPMAENMDEHGLKKCPANWRLGY